MLLIALPKIVDRNKHFIEVTIFYFVQHNQTTPMLVTSNVHVMLIVKIETTSNNASDR